MKGRTLAAAVIGLVTAITCGCVAADVIEYPLLPPMPLRTRGRWIVDADGSRVKLAGYNWNDGEGPDFTMSGLASQHRDAIAARLHELGFNTIRLVWSNELVETNPVVEARLLAANPDLIGRTALEVMDAVVESLAAHGVMVVMNNHISDAIYCCKSDDDNTLWYNDRFPETAWIADWQAIARRYRDQPGVIGADLRNEPRFFAYWGPDAGDNVDWAGAAERGGNAVLAEAPDWLVFVEGVNYAQELANAATRPLSLAVPNRLVYSIHDYPWFHDGDDAATMQADWQRNWAFLFSGDAPAPVWVGEFGTCNTCFDKDDATGLWFDTFTAFLRDNDLDWCWWPLHEGTTPDGWGMFDETTNNPWSADLMLIHRNLAVPTQGPGVSM